MDGRQIPDKPLTPNFERHQHVRSYFTTMIGTGLVNQDAGSYIEMRDFELGYAIYSFDLSASLLDGDQFELVKSGALCLELKFSQPFPEPGMVIVYAVKWTA